MYVSITGLKLNRLWHIPLFWHHAIASMSDARAAPGNLSAQARTINGVHHTLSTWDSRADMLAFLRSKRHAAAMRRFDGIATGRVCGFEAQDHPTWSHALARYHADGRDVYLTA